MSEMPLRAKFLLLLSEVYSMRSDFNATSFDCWSLEQVLSFCPCLNNPKRKHPLAKFVRFPSFYTFNCNDLTKIFSLFQNPPRNHPNRHSVPKHASSKTSSPRRIHLLHIPPSFLLQTLLLLLTKFLCRLCHWGSALGQPSL